MAVVWAFTAPSVHKHDRNTSPTGVLSRARRRDARAASGRVALFPAESVPVPHRRGILFGKLRCGFKPSVSSNIYPFLCGTNSQPPDLPDVVDVCLMWLLGFMILALIAFHHVVDVCLATLGKMTCF